MKNPPGRPPKIPSLPPHLEGHGRISLSRKKVEGGAIGDYGPLEGTPCVSLDALTGSEDFELVKYRRKKGREKGARVANDTRELKAKQKAEARRQYIVQTHQLRLISAQSVNQIAKAIQNEPQLGGVSIRLLSEDVKAARRSLQGR